MRTDASSLRHADCACARIASKPSSLPSRLPSASRLRRAPAASTCEIALVAVTLRAPPMSKLSHAPFATSHWVPTLCLPPGMPPSRSHVPNALNGRSNSIRNQVVYCLPPQKLLVTSLPSTARSPTTSTTLPTTSCFSLAWPTLTSTCPDFSPASKV